MTKGLCLPLSAELPLDVLMKHYAGAYAEGFEWPQPGPRGDEEDVDETEGPSASGEQSGLIQPNGPRVE